jgi:hypothetical protein
MVKWQSSQNSPRGSAAHRETETEESPPRSRSWIQCAVGPSGGINTQRAAIVSDQSGELACEIAKTLSSIELVSCAICGTNVSVCTESHAILNRKSDENENQKILSKQNQVWLTKFNMGPQHPVIDWNYKTIFGHSGFMLLLLFNIEFESFSSRLRSSLHLF